MAVINREEKFHKVLKFLISFHNPKVVALMAARGFDVEALNEGWGLLKNAACWMFEIKQLDNTSIAVKTDTIAKLDRWENTWFDVTEAALSRLFPEISKKLLAGISRSSGFGVVKNIQNFVTRLEDLEKEQSEESKAALSMLEKRGFVKAERDNIKLLLEDVTLEKMSEEFLIDPDMIEKRKKQEEEIWGWYLDWAKTARTVVASEKIRDLMGINESWDEPRHEKEDSDDYMSFLE
ncbi:hypothetical protein KKF34_04490 [Myxococcota bacterium]|nr:hypothetical protein [Myxococcota bacterium]MBU1379249.1 hypothetical protein [Myxococcota bacterium]MBU1496117.1 hypothetical protein [Myxococcota bacterium]